MSDGTDEKAPEQQGDQMISGRPGALARVLGVLLVRLGGEITIPAEYIDAMDGYAVVILTDKTTGAYVATVVPNDVARAIAEGRDDLPPITPTLVDPSKLN